MDSFFGDMDVIFVPGKKRRPSGRPKAKSPRQSLTIRLPADMVEWLKKSQNYTAVIEQCLRRTMKTTPDLAIFNQQYRAMTEQINSGQLLKRPEPKIVGDGQGVQDFIEQLKSVRKKV